MEIEVIKDNKNTVVNRREVEFYILQENKTPSKEEIKVEICKKLNLHPDSTVIVRVDQTYGTRQCKALVHSYHDSASMKKHEGEYLFERIEKANKRKAGQAAEAPKEEKKEAAKVEEK